MIITTVALAASLAMNTLQTPIPQETKQQHDARMKWWREARFGLFIHWGLYSVPAGKWNGKNGYGEWIREEAHIPVGEYEKLKGQFNPVKFDADKWAKLAADAGMKYLVITTKHHEGFDNFETPTTDWSIGHTPYGKDIMKQIKEACQRHGLRTGWYYSIMDWHHPDYIPRRTWEEKDRPVGNANFDRYNDYLHKQVTELLTNYGPIDVMWFDGEWEKTWTAKYGKSLYQLCRTLQPNLIINNRVAQNGAASRELMTEQIGDFSTPEQYLPATGLPGVDWETCMTMNDHWGYNEDDPNWKSSTQLIHNLIDAASKGGNYLLNVGPMANGEFPQKAIDRLHDIGAWMKVNGEAIYGTEASVFDSLPWGRCTVLRRNGTTKLYLHVFEWPKDGKLFVPGLGSLPDAGRIVGSNGALSWTEGHGGVELNVPEKPLSDVATVIDLEFYHEPVIYRPPTISASAGIFVGDLQVEIGGPAKGCEVRYTTDGTDPISASPVAVASVKLDATATVRAALFQAGKQVSPVVSKHFEKVTPWPAADAVPINPGLSVEEFHGDWDVVPDWNNLKPTRAFAEPGIYMDGDVAKPEEYVGRRYRGVLMIPDDAVYRFALTSDDGSVMLIDGKMAVDNNKLHGPETKIGEVALAKGPHRIEVGWFNKTGGLALDLKWSKVGEKFKDISKDSLKH